MNKEVYEIALSLVKGVGASLHREIIKKFGSAEQFFAVNQKDLQEFRILPFDKNFVLNKAKEASKTNKKLGVKFLCYDDLEYPEYLRQQNCPPPFLFYVGDVSLLNAQKKLSIVGTRNMTAYGKQITENVVADAIKDGVVIISGLAAGIDGVAHKSAIENNGKTIAVIGSGFMYRYPTSNVKLYDEIVENGGLIISEFLPDVSPISTNFPKRNRIVASLCDALMVSESNVKGGSLITVGYALGFGKDVFAVPGSIYNVQSHGCNKLISDGAYMILSGYEDIKSIVNWKSLSKNSMASFFDENNQKEEEKEKEKEIQIENLEERIIYEYILKNGIIHIDVLVKNLNMQHSVVLSKLTILELNGYIEALAGMKYRVI